MNSSLPLSSPLQNLTSKPGSDTVQKLRKELQLLIAELKDRDKELNDMVAVHQRQFLAWEDDRQKILTLEERSGRLENELHKRNEMITALSRRLKLLESQQSDRNSRLENTQQKLRELSQKASDTSLQCQTLEGKNQALAGSVMDLSGQVGQLQAREQELLTLLRLKDNDILEATRHMTEFAAKFKKLESALHASRMEEMSFTEQKQNFKLRLKEATLEINKLEEDLGEKNKENSAQREEIIQLKQENTYLSNELTFTSERASRKDELLLSAKAKQLRTDLELSSLRQVYVKQQQDLQFLHFSLESSQEREEKRRTASHDDSPGMALSDLEKSSDRDSVCGEVSQKIRTRYVHLPDCHPCQAQNGQRELQAASWQHVRRGPFHQPTCPHREEAKLSSPRGAGEAEDPSATRLASPWRSASGEMVWSSGLSTATSLPRHEHWLELNFCSVSSDCLAPASFDKSSGDCADTSADAARIAPRQRPSPPATLGNGTCESGCSACRNASLHQALTSQEWTEILKPAEKDGSGPWGRESSQSPRDAPASKSDRDVSLSGSDRDGPCFASTQQSKEAEAPRMVSGPGHPSGPRAPSGCCCPPVHHDSRSPTDKLQRLLADTQQMVTHLERSHLLGNGPRAGEVPECMARGRRLLSKKPE